MQQHSVSLERMALWGKFWCFPIRMCWLKQSELKEPITQSPKCCVYHNMVLGNLGSLSPLYSLIPYSYSSNVLFSWIILYLFVFLSIYLCVVCLLMCRHAYLWGSMPMCVHAGAWSWHQMCYSSTVLHVIFWFGLFTNTETQKLSVSAGLAGLKALRSLVSTPMSWCYRYVAMYRFLCLCLEFKLMSSCLCSKHFNWSRFRSFLVIHS